MRNTKKIIVGSAALILLACSAAFAAETGTGAASATVATASQSGSMKAPTLVSKQGTGVTLSWDKIDGAASYGVYYAKTSEFDPKNPDSEFPNDYIEFQSTGGTVTALEENVDYYFAYVTIDKEGVPSDMYSELLLVNRGGAAGTGTTSTGSTVTSTGEGLALMNATAVDKKSVSLEFSSALGVDPVTVKITKTSDSSDVPVSEVKADPTSKTKVIATIATVFDTKSSYSVTVLSAKDEKGNNIQQGVKAIKEFATPENLAGPEVDLNSATGSTASGALSGSGAVNTTDIKAPETGTNENIIVIVALVLAGLIISGVGLIKKFSK